MNRLLVTAFLLCFATAAIAQPKYYASISGGVSFPDDTDTRSAGTDIDVSFDTGFNINLALGMYLDAFRVEVEFSHREYDIDSIDVAVLGLTLPIVGDVDSQSLMFNGYYDFTLEALGDRVKPYIGGGLGIARTGVDLSGVGGSTSDSDTVVAFQFMAGVSVKAGDVGHFTLGYRLWTTTETDIGGVDFDAYPIHSIEVGLRYDF